MRAVTSLALALSALASSAHAQPVTGQCLWNALTSARQDEFRHAFRRSGADGVLSLKPLPSIESIKACGGAPTTATAASSLGTRATYVFIPTVIERPALHRLDELGFSADALDRSWGLLEESERTLVRQSGEAIILAKPSSDREAAYKIIMKAADTAGWKPTGAPDPNQTGRTFVEYYLTRAAREHFESTLP